MSALHSRVILNVTNPLYAGKQGIVMGAPNSGGRVPVKLFGKIISVKVSSLQVQEDRTVLEVMNSPSTQPLDAYYVRSFTILRHKDIFSGETFPILLQYLAGGGLNFFKFFDNFGSDKVNMGPESVALFISCLSKKGLKSLDQVMIPLIDPAWSYGELQYEFRGYGGVTCSSQSLSSATRGECNTCRYRILESGVDPAMPESDFFTPLMQAAQAGSVEGVSFLLLNGAARSINAHDREGCMCL